MMVDEKDIRALSHELNGREPWVESPIPPAHVLFTAFRLQETVGDSLRAGALQVIAG